MKIIERILMWILLPAIPIALYFAFVYAPTEQVMGEVQRIFYFHVASGWIALLSFFFVFLGGVLYLWKRKPTYDYFAHAACEVGVLFCTIVLITGPIWAKPVWNVWWTWDPRLTSTFILWFIFVAYLLLRASLRHHPSIRTYASVYGIIGFVDVPIVWMSIRWWRTIHPKVISMGKINMDPEMWTAAKVSFLALLLLYTVFMIYRIRLEKMREKVDSIQERVLEMRA
jgi:heme exporter protein C